MQVLLGGGQHQLDPVELVDLGSARIVVDGRYIGLGIEPADLLDDALAHDVVGEAAEGLDAGLYHAETCIETESGKWRTMRDFY